MTTHVKSHLLEKTHKINQFLANDTNTHKQSQCKPYVCPLPFDRPVNYVSFTFKAKCWYLTMSIWLMK